MVRALNNLDYVTVIVITKNEESNIARCLQSVKPFVHKLVIDSGSTDRTVEIAKENGAIVIHQDWLGFGKQKQRAMELAPTDWILSIDADEALSKQLIEEINSLDFGDSKKGYAVNRRTFFLGIEVRFSGWNPDWVTRLVNRKHARFTNVEVHEQLVGCDSIKRLNARINHFSYQTLGDIDRKTVLYGELGRVSRKKKKVRLTASIWAFFRTFFLKLGILDGRTGFRIACMNAKTTWIKYSD